VEKGLNRELRMHKVVAGIASLKYWRAQLGGALAIKVRTLAMRK